MKNLFITFTLLLSCFFVSGQSNVETLFFSKIETTTTTTEKSTGIITVTLNRDNGTVFIYNEDKVLYQSIPLSDVKIARTTNKGLKALTDVVLYASVGDTFLKVSSN